MPNWAQLTLAVIGGISTVCTVLQVLPGNVGHFFGSFGVDVRKLTAGNALASQVADLAKVVADIKSDIAALKGK